MKEKRLEFYGGSAFALLPLLLLIVFFVIFFCICHVYEMDVLAMGGLVALILGSFFAKDKSRYWGAVIKGVSAEMVSTVILIIMTVSFFGKMMARAGIGNGFVWIGQALGVSGSVYCMLTFVFSSILATSTGTSVGTVLTLFPIMYPSGLLLGSNPVFLAGAIVSGALFGDSIGPVSDVTIACAGTQEYSRKPGFADIGGSVKARLPYSLVGGAITCVFYLIFGGNAGAAGAETVVDVSKYADPKGLFMLIAVVLLLVVAVKTKNIFLSATIGTISGTIIALTVGILQVSDIIVLQDGNIQGFLMDGIRNSLGTIGFLVVLFGAMGLLQDSGVMDDCMERLLNSKLAATDKGAELIMIIGTTITGICVGATTTASCLMFGPVCDRLGKAHQLHPYRRANILAAMSCGLPVIVPFISMYIVFATGQINSLAEEFSFITPINPTALAFGIIYCIAIFFVYLFAALTGWQRIYEGENGEPLKEKPAQV